MGRISTAIAVFLLLAGEAGAVVCQADMQRGHGHWAWRLIEGRKCWYEGAPGMDKSLLHWAVRSRPEPAQASRKPPESGHDKPAQSSRELARSSYDQAVPVSHETRVKQTKLAPEVAPIPIELLQMLPIMPPEPTFEDRWRLR